MKIKEIKLQNFKRFTNLIIKDIPENAKLVVLVGPNGSGKTSLFEAFNNWYRIHGFSTGGQLDYYVKDNSIKFYNYNAESVILEFHDFKRTDDNSVKGKFYFRSTYRNEPYFSIESLKKQRNPIESESVPNLMTSDNTVSQNYQRIVSNYISKIDDELNNDMTVKDLRDEATGALKESLSNIFTDLEFNGIGNPLEDGSFYFNKGKAIKYNYKNLSSGEKSAFDLILDFIVKVVYFNNTIYCVDEPEAHIHTSLQNKLLKELFRLTPDNSQLWIATHSIGMLKAASELERKHPGEIIFLDFSERDFDKEEIIIPSSLNKELWNKFYQLAFDDFADLIVPRKIVLCEGNPVNSIANISNNSFDAKVYGRIFCNKYLDVQFLSIGCKNDILSFDIKSKNILTQLFSNTEIIKFVDRDDATDEEIKDLTSKEIKVSKRRSIESYLWDDEIIKKLCEKYNKSEKYDECIEIKNDALKKSVKRGNPSNDYKSPSGDIYNGLKKLLELINTGSNVSAFLRDIIAPLITEETKVFKELEYEIFGN